MLSQRLIVLKSEKSSLVVSKGITGLSGFAATRFLAFVLVLALEDILTGLLIYILCVVVSAARWRVESRNSGHGSGLSLQLFISADAKKRFRANEIHNATEVFTYRLSFRWFVRPFYLLCLRGWRWRLFSRLPPPDRH